MGIKLKKLTLIDKLTFFKIRVKNYILRLVNPWYYFPIKLSIAVLLLAARITLWFIVIILNILVDTLVFPFMSLKNFLKTIVILSSIGGILFSSYVANDYVVNRYGDYSRFLCHIDEYKLQNSVVRIVGGYSQGTGFFVSPYTIITNFHVIAGEPSPKIIFKDGKFVTPVKIVGNEDADIALITISEFHPNEVLSQRVPVVFFNNELVHAIGYPGGTTVLGNATILEGRFIAFRDSQKDKGRYIHTDIIVDKGMSGEPLVNNCGEVVGIITSGLTGNSFFISMETYRNLANTLTNEGITKIDLHPEKSPEDAVKAFYTYLKVRNMEKGYNLLSKTYLEITNYNEWTNRFTDILDVQIFDVQRISTYTNLVKIKFGTKNWVDSEMVIHYYEGTWDTIFEDGVYKMLEADIEEVVEPDYKWFWKN